MTEDVDLRVALNEQVSHPPITIRASSTPEYGDCARRTAARMLPAQIAEWGFQLRERRRNVGAVVGTASHAGVAHVLTEKMRTGEAIFDTEAKDRAEQAFKEEVAHGVEWDDVTPKDDIGIRQAQRIGSLYATTVAQRVKPIAIEQQLRLTTLAGNTLQGRVDLTTEAVRDLKTGKFQSGNIAQYGCYSLLIRGNGGSVAFVAEDYFKRVHLKDPQPQPKESIYDVATAEAVASTVVRRIERDYAEFMETGNPQAFQANPQSILCGEKFCTAWGTDFCKEHRK